MGTLHGVFFQHCLTRSSLSIAGAVVGIRASFLPVNSVAETATSLVYWMAGAAGLLLGSFLNVCITRLPRHQSIVLPASRCPRCQAPIRPWDNVPLVSFFLLRGRCRACTLPISFRYPLVEAGLAALFVTCVTRFGVGLTTLEAAMLCFLLVGLLVMDLETYVLPNLFTWSGTTLGLAQTLFPGHGIAGSLHLLGHAPFRVPFEASPAWVCSAFAGLGAAGLLLLIRWLYRLLRRREGLGLGDVKLAALLGFWLGGAGVMLTLFLGILCGGLVGASLIAARPGSGSENPQLKRLPLGAFLSAAGLITLFAGSFLLNQYFRFWP